MEERGLVLVVESEEERKTVELEVLGLKASMRALIRVEIEL